MTIDLALSITCLIIGLVFYFIVANPKLQEVGRLTFFAGLLVTLLRFAGHASLHVGS